MGVGHNLKANPIPNVFSLSFVVKRLERHPTRDGDSGTPITDNPVIGRPATRQEIQNDIDFLKRHSRLKHYAPQHLAKYTTVELIPFQIDALFGRDREIAHDACVKEFGLGAFTSPSPAKPR